MRFFHLGCIGWLKLYWNWAIYNLKGHMVMENTVLVLLTKPMKSKIEFLIKRRQNLR